MNEPIPIEFIEKQIAWYDEQIEIYTDNKALRETLIAARTALYLLIMNWRQSKS